jgi:hypothetical protein
MVVGGALFLLSKVWKSVHIKLDVALKFIMTEVMMVMILFNAMNIGYSLGIHFLYWSRPEVQ